MMGTYEVPRQFNNEDRYLKYFTKKGIAALVIGFVMTVMLYIFFNILKLGVIGIVLGVIFTAIGVFLCMYKIPESNFKSGAGQDLFTVLIRRYYRYKNKVIYTKCLNNSYVEIKKNKKFHILDLVFKFFI